MQKSYLFYDLETTGLNKCFDQIVQFAAIRTDLSFNELDRYEWHVRLRADVVPSPMAFATHKVSLQRLTSAKMEFDVVKKIHALVNEPGTISIGYNSLAFDDEMLRFAFYRNLLAPYTHQYANACQRMDIYPLVVMYALYKPEVLVWPNIDGHPSLKLELLAKANDCAAGQAHDAMSDVEMTLRLARKLAHAHKMWDYLLGFYDKAMDLKRQNQLSAWPDLGRYGLLIEPKFGTRSQYQVPVLALGQHQHYKNQSLWLHLDKPELANWSADTMEETTWVSRKRAAEPGFILPLQERFMQHLSSTRLAQIEANQIWLQQHPEELAAICDHYQHYTYPEIPQLDASAALYQSGFWQRQEETWMRVFHQSDWSSRAHALTRAVSARTYELGLRLVASHAPHLLSASQTEDYQNYLAGLAPTCAQQVQYDFRGEARLTLTKARSEADALLADSSLSEEQCEIVQDVQKYLQAQQNDSTCLRHCFT